MDLVLLVESGMEADGAVADTVRHVFAVWATHPVPQTLPDPPPAWTDLYPALANGLTRLHLGSRPRSN